MRKSENENNNRRWHMNNRGSALLTVVLVVTFLSILATTLLYISAMNFQIKQADYHNKKTFYNGEEELEYVKTVLIQDVSEATVKAYEDMSMNYASFSDSSLRELKFNNYFITHLQEVWDAKLATKGGYWDTLMASYSSTGSISMMLDYDTSGDGHLSSSEVLEIEDNDGTVKIKGLKVKYVNPTNNITTIITTDFKISAPDIDWSVEGSYTTLQTGHNQDYAATKQLITPLDSVIYTNWKKQ